MTVPPLHLLINYGLLFYNFLQKLVRYGWNWFLHWQWFVTQKFILTLISIFDDATIFSKDTQSCYLLILCFVGLLIFVFFSVRFLSVLRGHSFFPIPATTANDLPLRRIFYPRFYSLHLFSYLNSWERASIFLFNVQC